MAEELLPEYITKYDFNGETIQKALLEKKVESEVDNFNNLMLSSDIDKENIQDVERYLMYAPLEKRGYLKDQVENFFDTEFTEFVDIDSDHASHELAGEVSVDSDMLDEINEEIVDQLVSDEIFQKQIDELSNALDTEIEKSVKFKENANQNFNSARDLIVSQRIQLEQGLSESEFSDKFPFLPLSEIVNDDERELESITAEKFPFIGGDNS
jgi:hypothetical protein